MVWTVLEEEDSSRTNSFGLALASKWTGLGLDLGLECLALASNAWPWLQMSGLGLNCLILTSTSNAWP